MNMYKLTKDAKEKVSKYVLDGVISRSLIAKILNAESNDQVIEAMCSMYNLSQEKKMFLWYHTIVNVWSDDDVDSCFNELDCIFFRQLVENNGLLRRVDLGKLGLFNTDRKIANAADNLRDMGLIDIYRLSNYEIVYILSLNYYHEVFKNGEKR